MSVTERSGDSGVGVFHPSSVDRAKDGATSNGYPTQGELRFTPQTKTCLWGPRGWGTRVCIHWAVFSSVAAKLRDSPAAVSIDRTQGAYPGIVILMECVPGPSLMRLGVLPT